VLSEALALHVFEENKIWIYLLSHQEIAYFPCVLHGNFKHIQQQSKITLASIVLRNK
jgi:hypothetical protein